MRDVFQTKKLSKVAFNIDGSISISMQYVCPADNNIHTLQSQCYVAQREVGSTKDTYCV